MTTDITDICHMIFVDIKTVKATTYHRLQINVLLNLYIDSYKCKFIYLFIHPSSSMISAVVCQSDTKMCILLFIYVVDSKQ